MEKNYAKKQKGITLVALVVTIVILLILAGISLNIVLGNNGIITKAQEAKIENNHSTVLEMIQMKNADYETEYTFEETEDDFLTYLKGQQILDSNNVINISELIGKKLSTGNGNNTDVYTIEKDNLEKTYVLKYIGKTKEQDRELGTVGYEKGVKYEDSDPSIFEFEKSTGSIALKGAARSPYDPEGDVKQQIIVVPEQIDGIKVTKIGIEAGKNSIFGVENKGFGNNYVEKIVLPNTITEIRDNAFRFCPKLKEIEMKNGIKIIGSEVFYNCESLQYIKIPDSVESIGNEAFYWCPKLNSVALSKNMNSISDGLFKFCYELKNIKIPGNVTNIGKSAFSYCQELTGIEIPSNVTSIGDDAFYSCYKLSSIKISNGVKSIGDEVFCYCNISTIDFPASVTQIGKSIFVGNETLKDINVDENNSNYISENGILFNKDKSILVVYPKEKNDTEYTIPENVERIESGAFYQCTNLEKIITSSKLTAIGDEAFYNCCRLKNINLNDKINEIGSSAFQACYELEEITIPENLNEIKERTFYDCVKIKEIIVPKNVKNIGMNAFEGCSALQQITINDGVNKIEYGAFEGTKIVSITIPNSVTEFNFYFLPNSLAEINVEENNENYSSENGVLFNKEKSVLIYYPKAKQDSSYNIPSSVTEIKSFDLDSQTSKLQNLTIPNSVTVMDYYTFSGCKNVKVTVQAGTTLTLDDLKKAGLSESQITFEN